MAMVEVSLAVLSALGGLAAALQFTASRVSWRKARAATQEVLYDAAISEALDADQIRVLGTYLEERLGSITIAEYSADTATRARVSLFVSRISQFLEQPENESPTEAPAILRPQEAGATEFEEVEEMILSERVWDGLARLRRTIEIRLRELANESVTHAASIGAGQLLKELIKLELVRPDAVVYLKYAISVANRGVHGVDVSVGEALEALWAASSGLELLTDLEREKDAL